jgi:hypothetical protein
MNHKRHTVRIIHRYLGLFIGIQLLLWTASGLYFSWTNIEKIRGNHFRNPDYRQASYKNLIALSDLNLNSGIHSLELIEIGSTPFYWINESRLYNAVSGTFQEHITKNDAIKIVEKQMIPSLKIKAVQEIGQVSKHHEIRNKQLPMYVIEFENTKNIKAYISKQNGKLVSIRHNNWRIFDFFWMTHTMDYRGRDNFNNLTLRIFSLLGTFTVLSGFWLWLSTAVSSVQKNNGR